MKSKNLLIAGALALSTVMTPVASMLSAMPVSAETITISGETENHNYKAYKLFKGTVDEEGNIGNLDWADGVDSAEVQRVLGLEDSKASTLVTKLTTGDGAAKETAGRDVAKKLSQNLDTVFGEGSTVLDLTSNKEITDPGYYLMVDTSTPTNDEVVGLAVFRIVGYKNSIEITPKNDGPSVYKKVQDERNDKEDGADADGFGETADHEIGEKFKFKLTGNVNKTDINDYEKYYLEFNDTLSSGVDYVGEDVTVTLNGTDIKSSCTITHDKDKDTGVTTFKVVINDLKALDAYKKATSDEITIIVTYDAKLNENAIVNDAEDKDIQNTNKVKLIYSNNPNQSSTGEPSKGTTPEDTVFVATYKLPNKKTFAGVVNADLSASFVITNSQDQVANFKRVVDEDGKTKYILDEDTPWSAASYEKADGTVDEDSAQVVKINSDGDFSVYGLDHGSYTLKEVITPAGYTTASDKTVTISATHAESVSESNVESGTVLTLEYTIDNKKVSSVEINNEKGSHLPETGGMGTTMIYTVGGLLVVGSAVALVTNKRVKKED